MYVCSGGGGSVMCWCWWWWCIKCMGSEGVAVVVLAVEWW